MGGIGIIATAIAILPALGVGGMQLFRTESSDRSEKAMPRVRQMTTAIGSVYFALTALCAGLYWIAGMFYAGCVLTDDIVGSVVVFFSLFSSATAYSQSR